jgi:fatty acid desaturase
VSHFAFVRSPVEAERMTNDEARAKQKRRTFLLLIYLVAVLLALAGIALLVAGYWIGWLALVLAIAQVIGGVQEQRKSRRAASR